MDELVSMFRITRGTVHLYVKRGLLQAPRVRGSYGEEHVERLRAIRHLLHAERLSMAEVRERLDGMTAEQVRQIGSAPRATEAATPANEEGMWKRRALLPGLELHVASGASAFVKRIADEIAEKYSATAET